MVMMIMMMIFLLWLLLMMHKNDDDEDGDLCCRHRSCCLHGHAYKKICLVFCDGIDIEDGSFAEERHGYVPGVEEQPWQLPLPGRI